jgi:hypothetical protein
MANSKISALTSASTPLAGTETLPIVQSGATVKVPTNDLTVRNIRAAATTGILQVSGPTAGTTRTATVPDANWTAARTDAAQSFTGDQTLSTGNLIQGTAAKGINFTANIPAAGVASQLFNWFEEGTWTPAVTGVVATTALGTYTRIGKKVFANFQLVTTATVSGSAFLITGVPFAPGSATAANRSAGYLTYNASVSNWTLLFDASTSNVAFRLNPGGATGTINNLSGFLLWGTLIYTAA